MADLLHTANISPPPSGGNIRPTPPFTPGPNEPPNIPREPYPDYTQWCPAPLNFATAALSNGIVVPGRLVVYGFTAYSSLGSAQWVHVYDANAIPSSGASPLFAWNVSAHSGVGFDWTPRGRQFQTGLVLVNSTAETTLTQGAANCFFDVQFDVYAQQNAPGSGA